MKIVCKTLNNMLPTNTYRTPKGNSYVFELGVPTEVKDREDAEYFLNAGNGGLFVKYGVTEKVKETVAKVTRKPKYTEEELFKMNRKEQVELIRKLGGSNMRIPRREADRVKLILKLLG